MASQKPKLTEYERKRLDNIRRNHEMIAALRIHSKASELSKRPRVGTKSYSVKSEKKPKVETPIVIRRSLRTRGIPPESKTQATVVDRTPTQTLTLGPLSMADAREHGHAHSDRSLIESLAGMAKGGYRNDVKREEMESSLELESLDPAKKGSLNGVKKVEMESSLELKSLDPAKEGSLNVVKKEKMESCLELESLSLDPENIARIVPGRITNVRFFPSSNVKMIVAGSKFGNIGFWTVGGNEVYLYRPHRAPISGILVHPHCMSKMYTSCYDGIVRLMDAEKEIFDLVYESDESIYTLSQPPNEVNCLYFGEGNGGLTLWDNRTGNTVSNWALHESRINTIDFNSKNPHIVATSSTDGTACTWDLRYTAGDKLTALRTFDHKRSVQSAYFSPSGDRLATTSLNDTVSIYSGVNLEDATTISHNNKTGRWLSTFRAKWGWDDSYLFVGNMKRGVDVVSTVQREIVITLESPDMSAIPCRFDTHAFEVGMLAGATSGGQVYVWTSS